MKSLKQVFINRWETQDGEYIYLDEFGTYSVNTKNGFEVTDSFDKAVDYLNKN